MEIRFMKHVNTYLTVLFLIILLPLLGACDRKPPGSSTKELVIGISQDYRATDIFSHKGFNCLIFQTLVTMDDSGAFLPLLAKSWEAAEDGMSYTFHLREDAAFSDGTPLTAQQVKESMYNKQKNKRKRGPGRPSGKPAASQEDESLNREYSTFDNRRYNLPEWYSFQSIDVIAEHTLRINLAHPYTLFLNELATTHMCPIAKADDREPVTGYIGTGPYKIAEFNRTRDMLLVKNEYFRQGKIGIEKIRLKVIPDAETRAIALEAGEIQLTGYDHFDKIPDESVSRLEKIPQITVEKSAIADQPSISMLAVNFQKAPFTDADVREAIALAINRTTIDAIMTETGRTIGGPFPADYPLAYPNLVHPHFDTTLAASLLAKAGWIDSDRDGVLDRDGKSLSVSLCFNSFDPQYKTVAEIVQAQLKTIGIEVKLQMMELGAHISTMRSGDYDLALWPMMRYHMFFYTRQPSWLNLYNSQPLDEAFTRYLHGKDADECRQGGLSTQQLIMESRVFPLFFERFDIVAWNHDFLKNFTPQPLGWSLATLLWQANLSDE
jgi:peptide/nickel transport system substrate-binding protein